jgi:N-acetylmuramoyl-L-alanine amidase
MSATSIPVDRGEPLADASLPLVVGNRVLESIGRQEGFSALLAFSELHEQIKRHHLTAGALPDWDLFQTEQFFLDEVLQLICERVQALTRADAVIVALAHGPGASSGANSNVRSDARSDVRVSARLDLACRASAGALLIPRGLDLNGESALLRECLASGKTIRCDDLRTDVRAGLDLSQTIGARATVLVPLCGRSQRVGVVQAFSTAAWSFTDDDVRTLNLFAELILAALRPEDQDRRFHWLADVADDLLTAAPAPAQSAAEVESRKAEADDEAAIEIASEFPGDAVRGHLGGDLDDACGGAPVGTSAGTLNGTFNGSPNGTLDYARRVPAQPVPVQRIQDQGNDATPEPEFRLRSSDAEAEGNILTAHPGLSVVMGLVAVAALFSAGVWWGMQQHGVSSARSATQAAAKQFTETTGATNKVDGNLVPAALPSTAAGATSASGVSTSPPASASSSNTSDNLMDPAQAEPQSALSPVPASKLAALPKITGVRHWSSAMGTTVVIDLEDQVPYEVHRLMSPERIYFDLHDTALVADLEGKTMDVGDASLSRVRIAQPVAGVTRIVLDTKGGSNFSVSLDSDPYRLVVELRNPTQSLVASRISPAVPAKPVSAASLAASAVEPTPIKTGKFRVVLDAGHGGWDLGTVGRQGLLEKDLVLDVTRRLGKLLHDRLGVDVMFTRTGDDYLPLEQRADFANHAQADLFVSVHANYSASVTARGVETYYTNLFAAPGAKEVEKKSDGSFAQPTPVSLSAGALHEKIEESRRLAASVQRSLYATLAAKSPDIRDRGIKDAAFVVLTGTTMPAILTEISFVSSPTDEHNLQSEAYRQQIAEALYKGIARYQESSPRAKVAQLQPVVRR